MVGVELTGSEWLFPNRRCLLYYSPRVGGSQTSEEVGANGCCRAMLGRAPQPVQLPNNDEPFPPITRRAEMESISGRRDLNNPAKVWGLMKHTSENDLIFPS